MSAALCVRDQKREPDLWRKAGRNDIHFWPLRETLHWPMKTWAVSPGKPMTIILAGPFSSDLFQPFSLSFLIVSWDQLASWLWRWITLYPEGYIMNPCKLFSCVAKRKKGLGIIWKHPSISLSRKAQTCISRPITQTQPGTRFNVPQVEPAWKTAP